MNPYFNHLITKCKTLNQFKQLHAQITTHQNLLPHVSKLASFIAISPHGNLPYAKTIFDHLPNPTLHLYNALIRGFSASLVPQETLFLFRKMLTNNVKPNNMTFPFVIRACMLESRNEFGVLVHTLVLKCGFGDDFYVKSSLIKFYANARCLQDAEKVFDEMPERDVVCWNAMIDAYVKCQDMEGARKVFDEMPERDVVSWNCMVNGYGSVGRVSEAKKVFDEMPERNIVSWNSILAGYIRCGNVENAVRMFRGMPCRDVVSWNAMLACYAQNGKADETLALFDEMKRVGVKADEATVVSVLSAVSQLGGLDQGVKLHSYINKNAININQIVATALIDMYVKCGNIVKALRVFDSMQTKDVLAWNTMLLGMAMHGLANEAKKLFKQMQLEGIVPNDVTFVAIFNAFRHAGMTEEGQKLLFSMKDVYGIEPKIEHYGCVIDLLSRAGRLKEALNLIKSMPFEPNEYAYGALLGGCKIHGNAEVAQLVGKHVLDLEPQHGGRYIALSNIYAEAKRCDDARATQKLMHDNGAVKTPGVSMIDLKEHSFMVEDCQTSNSESNLILV